MVSRAFLHLNKIDEFEFVYRHQIVHLSGDTVAYFCCDEGGRELRDNHYE